MNLTDRQQNELEYHRTHAQKYQLLLEKPFSWDVLNPPTRWWNAYWRMCAYFKELTLPTKRALVVGCGFGEDALVLAKLGAEVAAFDLSPDMLAIARATAKREDLRIEFTEMPAEMLMYEDSHFDLIVARDILHHVDIPRAMNEIRRVARPNATLIVNEIYSHSITDRIRYSNFIDRFVYPQINRLLYSGNEYITDYERKLNERDIALITSHLSTIEFTDYFDFLISRVVPKRFVSLAKLDRLLLKTFKPL